MISEIQHTKSAPVKDVQIEGGLWGERQATNRNRTIPAIYHQMEITGRVDAWRLKWKPGDPKPHIFWDSDMGKWLEAVAYSLMTHPDAALEAQADAVIDLIEQAQQPDGYLNIFFTAVEPENRWKNLRDWHELYDAGHLIEGAVAYAEATGKRKLLDIMCRYTDHIDARFGRDEGKLRGYCGHPEIELALVRLYHATGEKRYFELSKYFVDERGQQPLYFDVETVARGEDPRNYWAKTYR
ncbi:MAG: glycoside hydrolase family 127 protein, partial [Anaerolineae bacterium]|nr:glycoside hydrolase family 127 protein [Anaerolineae bacterium]